MSTTGGGFFISLSAASIVPENSRSAISSLAAPCSRQTATDFASSRKLRPRPPERRVNAMKIDIVSDAICPWCYIGKRRLEQALTLAPQPELEIGWRPFQLNPEMPVEGMDRKDYLRAKFGDSAGGQGYERITQVGSELGIPFAFDRIKRTPNTIMAHRLIRLAARENLQDPMVETP